LRRNNGDWIIADPSEIALDAITQQQSTFTRRDHGDVRASAQRRHRAVQRGHGRDANGSPDLVELGKDGRGEDRFTTRDMIEAEQRLHRAAELMAESGTHEVSDRERIAPLHWRAPNSAGLSCRASRPTRWRMSRTAATLALSSAMPGTGKSAMLACALRSLGGAGYRGSRRCPVRHRGGKSGSGSGIASRTIASDGTWLEEGP
jgi:hypothetical protein